MVNYSWTWNILKEKITNFSLISGRKRQQIFIITKFHHCKEIEIQAIKFCKFSDQIGYQILYLLKFSDRIRFRIKKLLKIFGSDRISDFHIFENIGSDRISDLNARLKFRIRSDSGYFFWY